MSTEPHDPYLGTVIEKSAAEVVDEHGVVFAFLRFNKNGSVTLNWAAHIFTGELPPLPDPLRAEMVRVLRMHADGLESRDLDRRMSKLGPTQGAQA